MSSYIVRRLIQSIPLLVGITLISFFIMQMAPGDPMMMLVSPDIDVDSLEAMRAELGLDRPVYVQYFSWISQLLRGNMGYAVQTGRPVLELITERVPATLLLTASAVVFGYVVAIPLGVISALKQHGFVDYMLTLLAFLGISTPSFFAAILLVYVFAIYFNLLPTSGYYTLGEGLTGIANLVDRLRYLILPLIALSTRQIAQIMRFTRSSMLDVLNQDYVRTARAKGLHERMVIYKHALRNALLPIVTLLGLTLPSLIGGSFIIETIFAWPGMGRLGVSAIFAREYPILMGLNVLVAILVLVGNLLADVLYAFVDPRIQYS